MVGEIEVKVIPDTSALDKELKKPRSFTGLLGFGGGTPGLDTDKKEGKGVEKTNNLLGGILKTTGLIAVVATAFSGLIKLLRPFVDLFTALSFLVWFPLWKALKPVLQGLAKFVKNVAQEGGGFAGTIRAGEKTAEEAFEGQSIAERIAKAFLAVVIAAGLIIITAILAGIALIPAAIIAALAAIVTLIILAWEPIKDLFGRITQAWSDFFRDVGIAWTATIEFFKGVGRAVLAFIDSMVDVFGKILNFFSGLGDSLKEALLNSLSVISNIGKIIVDFVKDSLGSAGKLFGSVGRALNPFNDFIQRPGQAPTAFSPNDTVIGVKNPSALFGGGGGNTIHNTFQLGPINNDVDVERMAQRIAEINKDELAMSTGSQRF